MKFSTSSRASASFGVERVSGAAGQQILLRPEVDAAAREEPRRHRRV